MLGENIKNIRKTKGITQEELAIQLNVVRQTISKWEKGISVPDSEMLIKLAQRLDTSVNVLLGETDKAYESNKLQALEEKLKFLNEQFIKHNENRRKIRRAICLMLWIAAMGCIVTECIGDIHSLVFMSRIHTSASIIGGLDGPTEIYVSSNSRKIMRIFICITVAIGSAVGMYKTRRR